MPRQANSSPQPAHLDARARILQGSFYTPERYVQLVGDWLQECRLTENCAILDPSCGYGAFFALADQFPHDRFYGNDIDITAIQVVKQLFSKVVLSNRNALADVRRERYGIGERETLVVVGNPPYNDTTSQYQGKLKKSARLATDDDLKSRDLGLSSLLAYHKLRADYVAVLHPLSYLLKRANFLAAKNFFANYRLLRHVVFSSHEFAGTSQTAAFPVIVAFYERHPGGGLDYEAVRRTRFTTVEGNSFALGDFRFVTEFIDKYPNPTVPPGGLMFYTLRDINALRRSRTFLTTPTANAIFIPPEKLPYYSYVDCFKYFIDEIPYYLGNCDIPIDLERFEHCREAVVALARWRHPEVFGPCPRPPKTAFQTVRQLILSAAGLNGMARA